MTTGKGGCTNPDCDVLSSGVCVLGNDPPESCPKYTDEELAGLETDHPTPESPAQTSPSRITLRPNKMIPEAAVSLLRNHIRTRTVILIGEQKAGKTTLLAALYGLFCKGPVGGYSFARSRTLHAFAERNHMALVGSREEPTTPRTSIGDSVGFFHLGLRSADRAVDLLISDRSGEAFESATVNTAFVTRLTELTLADRVCLLLDAEKLTNEETRADYRRSFRMLLDTLLDNNLVPSTAVIEIVVTKMDKVATPSDDRDKSAEIREYLEGLTTKYGQDDLPLSTHEICALPRAQVQFGIVGLDTLIERWCEPEPEVSLLPQSIGEPARQIDLLLSKW